MHHKLSREINCLRYGYLPLRYWRNWFRNIKQFFRNIKYAYQRVARGYCDQDVWNLDHYLTVVFYNSLHQLAEDAHGYPADLTQDKWDRILKEMAEHFYNSLEDVDNPVNNECDYIFDEAQKEVINAVWEDCDDGCKKLKNIYHNEERYNELINKWKIKTTEAYNFRVEEKEKAFELMSKYFFDLWD